MMCYKGSCVNNSKVYNNAVNVINCNPNPCENGGKCVPGKIKIRFIIYLIFVSSDILSYFIKKSE
jgi:hypothetical protein